MKWRSISILFSLTLISLVLSRPDDISAASAQAGGVVVVCNDSVAAASLSRDDVQEMFLGRKTRWSDGQKVVLATLKEGDAHELFLGKYVGTTSPKFLNHWKKQAFTGRGRMPNGFATPDDLMDFVRKTAGAVGYVPSSAYQSQVKSITIE